MNLNIKNLQYIFINYKEDSLKQMLCASTKAKGIFYYECRFNALSVQIVFTHTENIYY